MAIRCAVCHADVATALDAAAHPCDDAGVREYAKDHPQPEPPPETEAP